jgi:hypothetical protein
MNGVAVIASSSVYETLRDLSTSKGQGRQFKAERRTVPYSYFEKRWGKPAASTLVPWLLKSRILFRGAAVKCPDCRIECWYSVDGLSEAWRCEGCQS